jgi:gliding motility-associated-like protein
VVSKNGKLFVATQGSVFVTSAPFAEWTVLNAGLTANSLTTLAVVNNQLFGITNTGLLFTWADGNTSWTIINTGFGLINSISASGENLFAATNSGIYLSTDKGLNWSARNTGLIENSIYSISVVNNYVIASARAGVTFFSDNLGSNWTLAQLEGGSFKLVEFNNILYAAYEFRAYYSANQGKIWEQVRSLPGARDLIVNGSNLIAGNQYGIYRSQNSFQWIRSNFNKLTNSRIAGFTSSKNHIFCATGTGEVLRSNNMGKSWTSIAKGLPLDQITTIGYFDNTLVVALLNYGIYRSDNEGGSWSLAAGIARITSFVKHRNQLVAGGASGIFISSDIGRTWLRLTNSPQSVQKQKLFDQGDTLFVTSPDYGVSFSVNNGQSWNSINEGIPPAARPTSLTTFQSLTLVGAQNAAPVYVRETIALPWQTVSEGFNNGALTNTFATDKRNIFAAGNEGVFTSTNGFNWRSYYNEQLPLFSSPLGIESLLIYRHHLFAGTEAHGVWVSCIEPPRPNISVIGNAPNDSTLVSDAPEGNQWYLNDSPIAGATQSNYKPVVSGMYSVKLILNECESEMSEVVDVFVKEYPDAVIEMPNVFTPDGDSYNPLFAPKKYDDVLMAEIQVVDRWGKEIFRSGDLPAGWNGGSTQAGLYYYRIRYTGKNGKSGVVNGWIHLIR